MNTLFDIWAVAAVVVLGLWMFWVTSNIIK